MTQYTVGIDLGTSNTVVAYAAAADENIHVLELEQLVGLGEVAARPLLPSLRYHPAPGELRTADLTLPWGGPPAEPVVIGMLARELGAQVPGRLVASAKSWLSHAGVDRTAPILPWGATEEVLKVSPVDASASYLAHVRAAWNWRFPEAPLERQELILTVPASFDEGARALTVEAARLAGLPTLRLLEEPQAAFYDWLHVHRDTVRSELSDTRLALVCDVGGGTTDLTLIQVEMRDGEPQLTRIGVGDHLMLGGDNMDLALAHLVEQRLGGAGDRLSATRFSQLIARCRVAKEQLLAEDAPDAVRVTLVGGGARLVGGARSVELAREEVRELLVEGFFPAVGRDELPQRRRGAIVEFGLPYPPDPGITRHLNAFLHQHAAAAQQSLGQREATSAPIPDTLLLNGGVFRAAALTRRLRETLAQWRGEPLRLLRNDHPELAVARGAVAYARARRGGALKIGGGSPRSYFLVIESADQADRQGICVLARGAEEGREVRLDERTFALRLGQPVSFHLVSSVADTAYAPGEVTRLSDEFVRLPPVATVMSSQEAGAPTEVPVQLITTMTEVGTLQMQCVATDDPARRWLLEFQLRAAGASGEAPQFRLPPRFDEAVERLERVFGSRSQQVEAREVKQLRAQLEHLLGKRDDWSLGLLRALYDAVWDRSRRRRRSAEHERLWLNLAGYCLRPGFGDALDEWRAQQVWSLYEQGIQYVNESQNWSEWWTLWRRAAGGLSEQAQGRLLDDVERNLRAAPAKKAAGRTGASMAGHDSMIRLAASLERVPAERKVALGGWLLKRLRAPAEKPQTWWAIGRLGARVPLYGSTHNVVAADAAAAWLEEILMLDWRQVEPAAFAAVQIARMTGDRLRDLPEEARERVARRLEATGAPRSWIDMVRSVATLEEADGRLALGDSLPPGLRLLDPGR